MKTCQPPSLQQGLVTALLVMISKPSKFATQKGFKYKQGRHAYITTPLSVPKMALQLLYWS